MARPNKRGLELSFHPTKRWCKYISGHVIYFSPGRGVSDRESYKKAIERYRYHMDTLREQASALRRQDFPNQAAFLSAIYRDNAEYFRTEYAARMKRREERDRLVASLDDEQVSDTVKALIDAPNCQRASIATLIDGYKSTIQQRHEVTKIDAESLDNKKRCGRKQKANILARYRHL